MDDGAERLVQELSQIVLNRITSDKLLLPCQPAAAARCGRLLNENDTTPRQLTEALERDPVLAAQVLRIAAAGGPSPDSLEQAVSQVGVARLRVPLGDVLRRQLAESRSKKISESVTQVWQHALAVAILARDLAALAQADSPDAAFIAGLLHDIGKVAVAGMLLEAEKQLARSRNSGWLSPQAWSDAVQKCHRPIGVALAER